MTQAHTAQAQMAQAQMAHAQWDAVDNYFEQALVPSDAALEAALQASSKAGLPEINVTPSQGKLLHLMARMCGAQRILEIGTLGGYSSIWLARALPLDGRLVTLEYEPLHAEVARENLERAGLSGLTEVRVGRALETLPQVEADGLGPFDFIFIDADKPSNPDYFVWALRLSRPGTVIVVDNVVRDGAVADGDSDDPAVQGIRRMSELAAGEPRVTGTAIQTVGTKGYDGFAAFLVTA